MEGFVSLHRKVADWEWYTDPVIPRVFFHCLLFANYKDAEWRGIHIKRGQFYTSYTGIADKLHLTIKQVRHAIDRMISTKELLRKRCGNGVLITICNYDVYQLSMADLWQTCGRPMAITNNNNKNNNNIEDKSSMSTELTKKAKLPKRVIDIDYDALMSFWNNTMSKTNIPYIKDMKPYRRGNVNARAKEYGKDAIVDVIRKVAASPFLNGDNPNHFIATFDWVMRLRNFPKIMEGNYDRR